MKGKVFALSQRYARELRKHLEQGPRADLQGARALGRQAVRLGLETLDVARIHVEALATLKARRTRDGVMKRAEIFFAEAVTPIERTHRAVLKANAQLKKSSRALDRRTVDLAASHRFLKQNIARRKGAEEALKKSGGHSQKLLEESRRLQKHLRHLTHQILTAQEDKRKTLSKNLQDEIAQTLLGINVRVLTLKKETAGNTREFQKAIVKTQRLIDKAGEDMQRFRS